MVTLETIKNQIDEEIETINKTYELLGYYCFTDDAKDCVKALKSLSKICIFSENTVDFILKVRDAEKTEIASVYKNMKRYLKAQFEIRIINE